MKAVQAPAKETITVAFMENSLQIIDYPYSPDTYEQEQVLYDLSQRYPHDPKLGKHQGGYAHIERDGSIRFTRYPDDWRPWVAELHRRVTRLEKRGRR